MLDEDAAGRLRADGYLVLRRAFDPEPLSVEMNRAFAEGLPAHDSGIQIGDVEVRYLPMMCERTPRSLLLLDALAGPAAQLLGRAVLPVRAKGSRHFGDSGWHRDSDLDIPSIGFVAYLESLDAGNGALRVVPGSHQGDKFTGGPSVDPARISSEDAEATGTEPGDVIAFDSHLTHGSIGGDVRRQWRVDFVVDPIGDVEDTLVRTYFERLYPVDWDGGYNVDAYPSYGPSWQRASRPWTERLRVLGVYDLADAQENAVRGHRARSSPSR